ncbi:Sfi1-domain-containing protein [Trichodelitschia bisporula]|uniref:Sfi1-domain-containing protein n=1 Tax=Trichodelitschia bisporula TaxID=703511 RepID=A0A6G1I6Q2_9PEZI|nr:Sfi1-domain-containing protein [Trichodelitschia bisporula]
MKSLAKKQRPSPGPVRFRLIEALQHLKDDRRLTIFSACLRRLYAPSFVPPRPVDDPRMLPHPPSAVPPASPPAAKLTDEANPTDVLLLHAVITEAEDKKDTSHPGVVAIYDKVRRHRGIAPGYGGESFAFLLAVLQRRLKSLERKTLFEHFKDELALQKITIDFVDDDAEEKENARDYTLNSSGLGSSGTLGRSSSPSGPYHAAVPPRPLLPPSEPLKPPPRPALRAPYVPAYLTSDKRAASVDTPSRLLSKPPVRPPWPGRAASEDTAPVARRRSASDASRVVSVSRPPSTVGDAYSYSADESATQSPARRNSLSGPYASPAAPPTDVLPAVPSFDPLGETQMTTEAENFRIHMDSIAQRHFLWHWRHRAVDQRRRRERLAAQADAYDRNVLLRSALEGWRSKLADKLQRRKEEETERFFEALERRAERAYNAFLLTKALTHWANLTNDEIERTGTARRHIMRTKYFNAWREITAVNELKVRRLALRKFLTIWRGRTAHVRRDEATALAVVETNAMRRCLKTWHFAFFALAAPAVREQNRKREALRKWVRAIHNHHAQVAQAVQVAAASAGRGLFGVMAAKLSHVRMLNTAAEQFRRRKLLGDALGVLRRRAVLEPRGVRFAERREQKSERAVLQVWKTKAVQERQAREFREGHLLRNAFTAWNDLLRVVFLEHRIDYRIVSEALYKMLLASRLSRALAQSDADLAYTTLKTWHQRTAARQSALTTALRTFRTLQAQRLQGAVLSRITNSLRAHTYRAADAVRFRRQSLLSRAFGALKAEAATVRIQNIKADNARFYLLTTAALRTWRAATTLSQKQRRRDAYAYLRRKVKMRIARDMLGRWHGATVHVQTLEHQADALALTHTRGVASTALTTLSSQLTHLHTLQTRASSFHTSTLTHHALAALSTRLTSLHTLSSQATSFKHTSTFTTALSCLRALNRSLFLYAGQSRWADDLAAKFFERHVKSMLRHWAERALAAREAAAAAEAATEGAPGVSRDAAGDVPPWTDPAFSLKPVPELQLFEPEDTAPPPVPGYLKTPSTAAGPRPPATIAPRAGRFAAATGPRAPATAPPVRPTDETPLPRRGRAETPAPGGRGAGSVDGLDLRI